MTPTASDIAHALDLCRRSTPGPYSVERDDDGQCVVLDANGMWVAQFGNAPDDAALFALARTLLPELVAEVAAWKGEAKIQHARAERALAEVQRLRKLMAAVEGWHNAGANGINDCKGERDNCPTCRLLDAYVEACDDEQAVGSGGR